MGNLARALIANPEVLCLHKPTQPYDDVTSRKILTLMCDFVTNKGIDQDPHSWNSRRPRTCVITSSKLIGLDLCDQIYSVSHVNGYSLVYELANQNKYPKVDG